MPAGSDSSHFADQGHPATAGSPPDKQVVFAFFSNRLGCLGSIIVSVLGSVLLLFLLRSCGAGL